MWVDSFFILSIFFIHSIQLNFFFLVGNRPKWLLKFADPCSRQTWLVLAALAAEIVVVAIVVTVAVVIVVVVITVLVLVTVVVVPVAAVVGVVVTVVAAISQQYDYLLVLSII